MDDSYTLGPKPLRRNFWHYLILLILILCAGYASRRYSSLLPILIRKRTGDALWACCVFVVVGIARPRWSIPAVTIAALLFSYSIECSQLYHRPWIDHLRSYAIGRLLLGTTFFWRDQLAYTIGVGLLIPVDWLLTHWGQIKRIGNEI